MPDTYIKSENLPALVHETANSVALAPEEARRREPIGEAEVNEAEAIRGRYRDAKSKDDAHIKKCIDWFKLEQRKYYKGSGDDKDVKQSTSWTFNVIANKHGDAMDNIPTANILPREENDTEEAKNLSDIIPVILEQCEFEKTYSKEAWYLYSTGVGAYTIVWNPKKHNGEGDIDVQFVDVRNLFYEPGIEDIQKSKNVFYIDLCDIEDMENEYPQLRGKVKPADTKSQVLDDSDLLDMAKKTLVVDWYYKRKSESGKTVLHYCKYCSGVVLYATENDPDLASRGWYDHGMYPFVIESGYPVSGKLCGLGMIDVCASPQEYVDRLSEAILENTLANTSPRYFARANGGVNETEFLDYTKKIVHLDGTPETTIYPINGKPLPGGALNVLTQKIDELKETSGTRDVATGGTASGVTAASAIAAMQEAGSKLSRDLIASQYRTFKALIVFVIELIRQYYTLPRCFRILGERGAYEFIKYTNAGLVAQDQGDVGGTQLGQRLPMFDVEIVPEKKSPYKRISQNELILQFYQLGLLAPQNADQALLCFQLMDFDNKDTLIGKVSQNATLLARLQDMTQRALAYAQALDTLRGTNFTQETMMAAQDGGAAQMMPPGFAGSAQVQSTNIEPPNTRAARQRVAESTSPT